MIKLIHKHGWRDVLLIIGLIFFDILIHPLTPGPDRLIHDPAVYRLANSSYMIGDWYTDMAVKSNVYIFYAKLVMFGPSIGVPEEMWRMMLYLISLAILYYALIRIARLFTPNIWVVPVLVILHAFLNTGYNQPPWLYGPFIQIDGGLAPRSIGVALSFLALYFLLRRSLLVVAGLLGLATFIHVSNSFIVFTLFWLVWLIDAVIRLWRNRDGTWGEIARHGVTAGLVYLCLGGWFALYVAFSGAKGSLSTEQFIWTWVYFRAPYMALPLGTLAGKMVVAVKLGILGIGWYVVRRMLTSKLRPLWDMAGLIGLGAMAYFAFYYVTAFVVPWLPGFQFYSIRIVYFAYWLAFLMFSLLLVMISERLVRNVRAGSVVVAGIALLLLGWGVSSHQGKLLRERVPRNIAATKLQLGRLRGVYRQPIRVGEVMYSPDSPLYRYVTEHPEPLLTPINWVKGPFYVPSIVTFKSFGFTEEGLAAWFNRMNDLMKGDLARSYVAQEAQGTWRPFEPNWTDYYNRLTVEDIRQLSEKYHFRFFVAARSQSYPFQIITEDNEYRLYRIQ
jgi:hypothetical protein